MRAANIEKWEELRISDPEEYKRLTAQRDELHKKLELGPFGKKMLDCFQASLLIAFLTGWMEWLIFPTVSASSTVPIKMDLFSRRSKTDIKLSAIRWKHSNWEKNQTVGHKS